MLFREIGTILRMESKDARFKRIIVSEVKMSADLGLAKVYFTVEADSGERIALVKALNQAQGFFRAKLSERVEMRCVPQLRFYFDEDIERLNRIEKLFREIHDEKKP